MQKRLLLIEQDPFVRSIYAQKLRALGIEVRVASDGVSGVDRALEDPPHMVVMDFVLPGLNGMHVLKKLKASTSTQNIPVVVISNHTAPQDIERMMRIGARAYLLKNQHTSSELASRIHAILRQFYENG